MAVSFRIRIAGDHLSNVFLSMMVIHALVAIFLSRVFGGNRIVLIVTLVLGTLVSLISFSDGHDLTLLPDTNWRNIEPLSVVTQPVSNPYLSTDVQDVTVGRQAMQISGAILYEIIPNSPWATAVKGTLEAAFRRNPNGGTQARLYEHYAAFLAAHGLIGR